MKIRLIAVAVCFSAVLSGCDKINIDRIDIEGKWNRSYADERVSEDGNVAYTFLSGGKCFKEVYNALNPDLENATTYSVCTWSQADDTISITGNNYESEFVITKKSKGKLWSEDGYVLTREEGLSYKKIFGWVYENKEVVVDGGETRTMTISIFFEEGQECVVQRGIAGLYAVSRESYHCYYSPESRWFVLVDKVTNKKVYEGRVESADTMTFYLTKEEKITLKKLKLE
ncbi:MAG: hypothetical protein HUJ93_04825 [Bacteroidales bacterium]|nr:hypothetical protein [Bacteroidales bacterium]